MLLGNRVMSSECKIGRPAALPSGVMKYIILIQVSLYKEMNKSGKNAGRDLPSTLTGIEKNVTRWKDMASRTFETTDALLIFSKCNEMNVKNLKKAIGYIFFTTVIAALDAFSFAIHSPFTLYPGETLSSESETHRIEVFNL